MKIEITGQFKRDINNIRKRGWPIGHLQVIIDMITKGDVIPPHYHDHKLRNYAHLSDVRELHIKPDWLLIYHVADKRGALVLIRTGTHSDLFK